MSYNKKTCYSIEEIESSKWEVIKKICDIIFDEKNLYYKKTVEIARSILSFINDWGYITHKQYDFILFLPTIKEDKKSGMSLEFKSTSCSSKKYNKKNIKSVGYKEKAMLKHFKNRLDEKYLGGGIIPFDVGMNGEIYDVMD